MLRQRFEWAGLQEQGRQHSRTGQRKKPSKGVVSADRMGGPGGRTVPPSWSYLEVRVVGWPCEPLCQSGIGCRLPPPGWGLEERMAGAARLVMGSSPAGGSYEPLAHSLLSR